MNRYIVIILISSLYLLTLTACIKEVDDIDLPSEEPQLVVASFISPQDQMNTLILSWSQPIFGYSSNSWGSTFEPNASVVVSDGSQNYTFAYNAQYEAYTLDTNTLKYEVGKEYTLSVKHNDTEVSATSQIPVNPAYKIEHLNSVITYNNGDYKEYKHNFVFTVENTAKTNYYRILMRTYQQGYISSETDRFVKGSNGEEHKVQLHMYKNSIDPNTVDSVAMSVMNCSEAYYNYHQSVFNYTGDNPFAEPTIVYSNVENGLGIFGGFQMKEETIVLPIPQ